MFGSSFFFASADAQAHLEKAKEETRRICSKYFEALAKEKQEYEQVRCSPAS